MKGIEKLKEGYPLLNKLIATEEVFWVNPNMEKYETAIKDSPLNEENVKDAEERLKRFASYIAKVFLKRKRRKASLNHLIENPFYETSFRETLRATYFRELLKCDSHLPISGSIKARGGVETC